MFWRGRALWMVSVALFSNFKQEQIHRMNWTKQERKIARSAALSALTDAGDSTTDTWEDSGSIIALRRRCRDDERRLVVEKYLQT